MSEAHRRLFVKVTSASFFMAASVQAADIGTAFTYQGSLEKPAGTPVTDTCDFRFGLWDAAAGGNQVGTSPQTVIGVAVKNAVFSTPIDFGAGAIDGAARWLAIEVKCTLDGAFVPLDSQRVALTPAPHALALPGFHTQEVGPDAFNVVAINVIGGSYLNSVASNVYGATVAGGGYDDLDSGEPDFPNTVSGLFGTVTGGIGNTAADYAFIGGGVGNSASGSMNTIAGGAQNTASNFNSAIGGGLSNSATGSYSFVGGGNANQATGFGSAVSGGNANTAAGSKSMVGGGDVNRADGDSSFVGGGGGNLASGFLSAIGGGSGNTASTQHCTVSGGRNNSASGLDSTVCGGEVNAASGLVATVCGGSSNTAGGLVAIVLGGIFNRADGDYSLAAGRRARVRSAAVVGDSDGDNGTFVWADSTNADFTSTGPNQFLVRAAGGVGIGTNSPSMLLDVNGPAFFEGNSVFLRNPATAIGNQTWGMVVSTTDGKLNFGTSPDVPTAGNLDTIPMVIERNGYVGIGDTSPSAALTVSTTDATSGDNTATFSAPTIGANQSHIHYGTTGDWYVRSAAATGKVVLQDTGGNVGIGDTTPDAKLDVVNAGAPVAIFNRTGTDGRVITIEDDGVDQGGIQVVAGVVSISAFTGTHYAWSDRSMDKGTLVVMTGDNRFLHDAPGGEPLYGVEPSSTANDARCLGSYLGLSEPQEPSSSSNPHLIMAVGNGDMWVVDTGRNIEPGQYLISSDVRGHAMLDDEARFAAGYVVARAGEGVDWANVSEVVDGRKHKRISVFFESFERGSAVAVGKIVEEQQKRIDELSQRLSAMETSKHMPWTLATAGIVCFGLGGVAVGGRTLRRRGAKGGAR